MEIKDRIRKLRMEKGVTQEYVAYKIGIEPINYGRIERGDAKLTVERLREILDVFGVSMVEFFKEEYDSNDNQKVISAEVLKYLKLIYTEITELNNILTNSESGGSRKTDNE